MSSLGESSPDGGRQQSTTNDILELNVGGQYFKTSRTTLTSQPGSMLAAMFSGRYNLLTDDGGRFFIDRDGHLFQHVLAWLRDSRLPLQVDALPWAVYREAQYYGLDGLTAALRASRGDVALAVVRETRRAHFPNYYQLKQQVVEEAVSQAVRRAVCEVLVSVVPPHAVLPRYRTDTNDPQDHPGDCPADSAHFTYLLPASEEVEPEFFIQSLSHDFRSEGFDVTITDRSTWNGEFFCPRCLKRVYCFKFKFVET